MKNEKTVVDIDYAEAIVPKSARRGIVTMFMIMLGFTFFSASMWVGQQLADGLDFQGFVVSMIVGGVILSLYTGLLGYVGAETGMSLDLLARKAFGVKGSYLPSAMISFTQIGWFGVGIAMFAIPVANELLGGSKTAEWALVIVAGICMTASAYFGIKSLTIVSYIAVPMVAVLGTVAMVLAVMRGDGTIVDQFAKSSGTLTVIGGAGLVVGSFVSGGTATPNFSRFARNYILVGEYLEQIFPFLGVRFISINDGYDSKTSTSTADNMSMVLKSVLNAYYSKELSQKIRTTFDQKMKRGEILGHPPFGYVLNDERTQYIIDPEAAKTIKRMFELAYEGKTLNEIAGILTAENYLVPSVYIREKRPRNRSKQPVHEVPMWSTTSIQRMLRNRAYSGTLVLNTTKQAFPGSKSSRKTAPEEQYVFENAHEPIVSKEVFDFVQTRFGHKITKTGLPRNHEYVLKGLVVCGNCKRLMAHCHRTNSFTCRKKAILNSQCPQKKFTDSELETAVFQSLQPMLQLLHLTINKKAESRVNAKMAAAVPARYLPATMRAKQIPAGKAFRL